MDRTEKLIKKLRTLEKTLKSSDCTTVVDAVRVIENAVPAIDLLQARLEKGAIISYQDNQWHLFDRGGEGITAGESLKEILLELIWLDG